jgi:acetyl-CoA synthetase (ADP-forming)
VEIIEQALARGARSLSEHASKQLLAREGIPTTIETIAGGEDEAVAAAVDIGYPVVLKGSGETISHKSELGLIAVDLRTEADVRKAYRNLTAGSVPVDEVLVQQMIGGDRELVMGLNRDPRFGPCVMFGLGGIYTEIFADVVFGIAPLSREEAMAMLDEIRGKELLSAFRGQPAADREALAQMLVTLGQIGIECEQITEIDINPVKLDGSRPVAVDALVILSSREG